MQARLAEAGAAHRASGARQQSLCRLTALVEQYSPTAQSILADALQTTRAHEQTLPWSPATPVLSPSIQSLVLAAISLLLHVQASASVALSAEETLLLLESSLAGVQPKARAPAEQKRHAALPASAAARVPPS